MAERNLNNSAKSAITTAKNDIHNRQYGGDYKTYTKPYTNNNISQNSNSKDSNLNSSINLTHGQNGDGLNLRTDNLSFTNPQNGYLRTPKMGIGIDNKIKDNRKDITNSQKESNIKHVSKLLEDLKNKAQNKPNTRTP
jgi:hypothetical protein